MTDEVKWQNATPKPTRIETTGMASLMEGSPFLKRSQGLVLKERY